MNKVALVIGHRASKPGYYSPFLELYEYQFYCELSKELLPYLDEFEVVVYFKDGFSTPYIYEQIQKWNPGVALELHFNAHENSSAYGTETLCMQGWGYHAMLMQNAIATALKRDKKGDRGFKLLRGGDRGFENVSQLDCATLLLEPFFGSNREDCALFESRRPEVFNAILSALRAIFRNPVPKDLKPV